MCSQSSLSCVDGGLGGDDAQRLKNGRRLMNHGDDACHCAGSRYLLTGIHCCGSRRYGSLRVGDVMPPVASSDDAQSRGGVGGAGGSGVAQGLCLCQGLPRPLPQPPRHS